jgi:hypothetical protein
LTPHRAVAARKTMMSDYDITEPLTMVRAEAWTGFLRCQKGNVCLESKCFRMTDGACIF